ncbi:hypothetical protein MASR2M78_15170 [Treponema sp.]
MIDLLLTDLRLADGSGQDILATVKKLNPMVPVVVMTMSDVLEAVAILKAGADDYLVKPTAADEIEKIIIRVNEKSMLIHEAFLPLQKVLQLLQLLRG